MIGFQRRVNYAENVFIGSGLGLLLRQKKQIGRERVDRGLSDFEVFRVSKKVRERERKRESKEAGERKRDREREVRVSFPSWGLSSKSEKRLGDRHTNATVTNDEEKEKTRRLREDE